MSKARTLANLISDNADLADGQISVAEVVGAAPLANPTFTGTTTGTFSGSLTGDVDLSAIAKDITDTAVDVFVYDTSKDSDGGAWRKRTQGTSWYNETLNTSTRGATKKFPAVAVIVAEAAKVTIYDGDDPSLPMWMVFNEQNNNMVRGADSGGRSLSMFNGVMCSGCNGVATIDFVKDDAYLRYSTHGASFKHKGIYTRNGLHSWNYGESASQAIASTTVNDVAMTVLPNAPIDAATGLPVPTIAVATAGGVSVITDSGAVYDSAYTPTCGLVYLSNYGVWYAATNGTQSNFATWEDVSNGDGFGDTITSANATAFNFPIYTRHYEGVATDYGWAAGGTNVGANSTGPGLQLANLYNPDFSKSMQLLITSTYNTGWMNGEIKGAFLSDTDDTDLVGAEFATLKTPDVACSPSGITLSGSTITVSAEVGVSLASSITEPFVGLEANTSYVLKFTKTTGVGGGTQSAWIGVGYGANTAGQCAFGSHLGSLTLGNLNAGDYSLAFTTGTRIADVGLWMRSVNATADFTHTLSNVSVRLADADRSVNANGLIVNGTVTKTPVATGADLVAYSGFSVSNNFMQPNNSDLNFGTGDFCFAAWIDTTNITAGSRYICSRDGQILFGYSSGDGGVIFTDGEARAQKTTSGWTFLVGVRESGFMKIYTNGVQSGTSNASTRDVTSATAQLGVGGYWTGSAWSQMMGNASLALLRISGTAPSAEQIAKIYNDEKVLFQENAQATLYGTSNAVTALAYDDTTELLHVGTSAGRSVFQGLRRVDNTTTAVGAAISASNGLVAED
tara:strand:- start:758 stop:3136 length:2379 start_codon:yes stop_codon:yes gene_type:complete